MQDSLDKVIDRYDPQASLERASTIPALWYTDERLFELEKQTVFSRSWQFAARIDQLSKIGDYVTTEVAREPIVVIRGSDHKLRAFFNVCRHHAAAVMTEREGQTNQMRCPYHGWTYSLEGELKGTPDFSGVCNFDRADNGLVPVEMEVCQKWAFVKLNGAHIGELNKSAFGLDKSLDAELIAQIQNLKLTNLQWAERRGYTLNCNWKVFVDNYLDGGYHVPYLHKGLDSVLDYRNYTIEIGERFCLQSSPMGHGDDAEINAVRTGKRALYYWLYPNFMINWYEGMLDTNLVRPLAVDRTEVIFDYYFADVSGSAQARNLASIEVSDRIQQEDLDICESIQRGLKSRAYEAGRLSVRREAGEHLFHRLLYADLKSNSG